MAFTTCPVATDVISSLGTTPQERGLTTEEFKAAFDKFGNKFVEWFNTTHITEANEHKNETAQKHITESGSNENGSYIKFDDGTMICYKLLTISTLGVSSGTWTFPATFVSNPIVNMHFSSFSSAVMFDDVDKTVKQGVSAIRNAGRNVTNCDYFAMSNSSNNQTLDFIAIGRWK